MTFYHIDRDGTFPDSVPLPFPIPNNFALQKAFPEISRHGLHYLIHEEELRSTLCEWILEYVRATQFPHMPSRFTCLFASKTKEDALRWANYMNVTDFNLIEIEADNYCELDCSWFTDSPNLQIPQPDYLLPPIPAYPTSTARIFEEAVKYWGGLRSNTPRLETLIQYPYRVTNICHHHA